MMNDVSEGEDDDSSSLPSPQNFPSSRIAGESNTVLDEFREKWQNELISKPTSSKQLPSNVSKNSSQSLNDKNAGNYFLQGVELEKKGKVYDALQFYRKAIQLDPDIEFKFYESLKENGEKNNNQSVITNSQENSVNDEDDNDENNGNEEDSNEDLTNVDLYVRFQQFLIKNEYLIRHGNEPGVISTGKHISELPTELIFYILKWVVSTQLDIRSLENCATACKGLYLCAKDDEIWHLICLKVWGINTGPLTNTPYTTWRDMFIERHRVQFNGCYISKTTYLRYGENSFQDQFYRPVQLIEYYRYFRFLPDHSVLMWTTTEEPSSAVTKLKNINQLRPEILRGHYRFHGDIVTLMLKKYPKNPGLITNFNGKRRGSIAAIDNDSHTYYIEFTIVTAPKRRCAQLQWKNYSMIQIKNKKELSNDFDLVKDKYPPLWFSRVKSYHLESDSPLQ